MHSNLIRHYSITRWAALALCVFCFVQPTLLAPSSLASVSLAQPSQEEFTPLSALWKRFSHADGRFKVLLPGEPDESASVIETRFGRFERIDRHDITLRVGRANYVISYADLPANLTASKEVKQFLNSVRDAEVTRLKGKLSWERETPLAGHPGRELSAASADVSFRMRFCLVERRLYQLGVTIPSISETPDPKSAKYPSQSSPRGLKMLQDVMTTDFFNSFKPLPVAPLTPSPQATPPPKEILVPGGVMQGAALKRVAPSYLPLAKATRVSGRVDVQVIISEEGRVIEAEVVSSPPLLWEGALNAAKQWVFKPTELSGAPVKVKGVLTFNFTLQ
ncbi:MAG: TonB family protein [Acidobacteria bacterium]|nr:TonB family protein [Acidobacteriota bacterium]